MWIVSQQSQKQPYNWSLMALPKTRYAHARQGERRAHLAMKRLQLVECPQCHQPKRPHTVCRNCGYYKGREVIKTD
jgi:large subunit ribosomal protein L32